MAPFALLDDRDATTERPTSRLYTGFVREHRCTDEDGLDAAVAGAEADLAAGLHAVVLADYEWGAKLQRAGTARLAPGDAAALRLLMFERLQALARDDVTRWLDEAAAPAPAGVMDWQESVTEAEFVAAIGQVHEAIRAGETYQVNFTYRMGGRAFGHPLALYRRLRARQPVPYGALIALPPQAAGPAWVLSCSPELFLRHHAGRLTAQPMKGTAPRSAPVEADHVLAQWLAQDTKNRAENLMIVDLLRNDLGRIAELGSVKVPALFAVQSHATVFQMTSTVQASLRPALGFADVLRASFPCGSITGAPKLHTMDLIARFERLPRALYTGSIGWLDAPPPGRRCGDFCLSVAIRTLSLQAPAADGTRPAQLGVGAGIVLDSEPRSEFAECRLKARFATTLEPGLALIETMAASRDGGVRHLERHLARLAASAAAFGFVFDEAELRAALQRQLQALAPGPQRLRLRFGARGIEELAAAPLPPLAAGPVLLRLAAEPSPLAPALARHKTTERAAYDAAVQAAQAVGAFDTLFFSAAGRLTEGGRSNVFVRLGGRWCTPPLDDGVLPGVMRSVLLDDPQWGAAERSITRDELLHADAIVVCNALRGVLPARLLAASA
jgi:para-aminobenzoate synthetase / 4-amino-4-deoxychorismate lyase